MTITEKDIFDVQPGDNGGIEVRTPCKIDGKYVSSYGPDLGDKLVLCSRIADELEQAWWNMPQNADNAKWVTEYMEPLISTLRGAK